MAASPKKSERSADEWLISDSDGVADDRESQGGSSRAETRQWLVETGTGVNGGKWPAPAPAPSEASFELPDTAAAEPEPPAKAPRKSSKAPAKADAAAGELRAENRELAKRIRELQAELSGQSKRLEKLESDLAVAKKKASGAKRKTKAKRSRRRAAGGMDPIDVNEATFEDLRSLGLSVTQCARVIAYRDTRGGYESLDELEDVPGLPRKTVSNLRSELTLSA